MSRTVEQAVLQYLKLTMLGLLLTDPVVYELVSRDMSKHKRPQNKRCSAKYPPRPKANQYPIQCWVWVDDVVD